ncbi:hypothetical protein [Aestuariivirga litoralis]|uniref:hypothetical protein n=1 Tax=Aestuariivirga litoralis TaxID=2650924 RepID=UPI0018C69B36|nr:hypothetical protein [Aestuariivirga litoralis]MBG1231427.1 hypothetical protein [Aestuariivirga litoralis]
MVKIQDVTGWRDTYWGMGVAEVSAVTGQEYLVENTNEDFKGLIGLLKIPLVYISDEEFEIVFQFEKSTRRLAQVHIRSKGNFTGNSATPLHAAKRVLTESYGTSERIGTRDCWVWQFPTTTIELFHTAIADISSFTAIRFTPTINYQEMVRSPAF